jgi:squalene-hopene/tetraprenyl-beta-curcumene cyclase
VSYVLRQWRTGFGELAHQCRFASMVSPEVASGDVFQRALVADALCDLPPPWRDAIAPVLASEHDYLLAARRCPVRGWSYYPRLEMIPPDADSLGQILQLTVRLDRRDLSPLFEDPIDQALHVGALGDGSFATWIVPPPGARAPLHERQAALVSKSADVEVVANLAYALLLFDRSRFAPEITAAARWVASRQRATGTWSGTWYLGTAYTTYAAVRLLAAAGGFSVERDAARQYIMSTQRRDGGWGRVDEPSNPLDTAHALLALDAVSKCATEPVRGRALDYLAEFSPDAWPAVPFICQERDDPRPLASRTITAAYVAKALARCWP